ncbi:MAG TPA: hypothetical protein VIC03_00250 [Gemmatimonadaceae bacterium]
MPRSLVVVLVVAALEAVAAVALQAQDGVVLNGRTVDSAGIGVAATIVVRSAIAPGAELGSGNSDAAGSFHVKLVDLPARLVVDAIISGALAGRMEVDSAAARGSSERPILLHVRLLHPLAPVRVQARYQKRPSIYNFMEGEPSSRVESVSPITTEWFDPLSAGDVAAIFRVSPDMMIGADGTATLLGAPSSANQLQIGGMQVPAALVTGMNGASVTSSPWDITIGGAAGATANVMMGPPRPNHATYATVESGVGGVPNWVGGTGQAGGIEVPIQINVGSSGPMGQFGYSGSAFFHSDDANLPRWDKSLDARQMNVLDSISRVLGAPTVDVNARNTQSGVMGRLDLVPFGEKRVLALTSALTRSQQSGGTPGGYFTGSLGSGAVENVGLLQLESKNILRERVLLTSQIGVSESASDFTLAAVAPTIVATDFAGGNTIMTGGAAQRPSDRVFAAEARTTAAWYSRDNRTRYVAQLQARGERARLDGTGPHSTFIVTSLDALQGGRAIALTRESGTNAASASSFVFAPALGARRDLGQNGSLLVGVRADAWATRGVVTSGSLQHVDVSPRISLYERLGRRSANRGPVASLMVGAGRFTSWPDVQQWADAWAGSGASREICSGSDVPAISLGVEAASCLNAGSVQAIGATVANNDLRPAASNRADASLSFAEIVPGVSAQFGVAVARNDRLAARLTPLLNAPVITELAGDGGRALLVPESAIGSDGIVPVARIPAGVPYVTRLVSDASSTAAQWRIRIGGNDPFTRVTWTAAYVLTTGHESSMAIAPPTSAPALVSGPLAAAGRHSFAFSLGTWIGEANIRIAGLARSGVRFTPLADRDLNGDGLANDAAFIPQALANVWAKDVTPAMRGCVLASAGRIAELNSCTGPWSVTSFIYATIPGVLIGLPRGANVSIQLSNPLGAFAGSRDVTFGNVAPVNATLVHVTGFNAATNSFAGEPLSGFGKPLGLANGIGDPLRLAIGIHIPLGPSVISQRTDKLLEMLQRDTSSGARTGAAMNYLGDIPPLPLAILQSADAIQITAGQRKQLQTLGNRWMATASRLVLAAYGSGPRGDKGGAAAVRTRLALARAEFFVETGEINSEIRNLLTPDQVDLLPTGLKMMLNPRFWTYVSLYDAGDI